ncbi:hypothetical protein Goshw_021254, partial [Gossypium schwendimanii]|nr:hypothetical protein [Gossypium schwendimanii]
MAATCGRRTLGFSCSSAKTIFTHLPSSTPANNKLPGLFSPNKISASRFSLRNLTFSRFSSIFDVTAFLFVIKCSGLPVEMGGAVTLIPLHSATASALFTSLLSLHNQSWGCLSE